MRKGDCQGNCVCGRAADPSRVADFIRRYAIAELDLERERMRMPIRARLNKKQTMVAMSTFCMLALAGILGHDWFNQSFGKMQSAGLYAIVLTSNVLVIHWFFRLLERQQLRRMLADRQAGTNLRSVAPTGDVP